LPITSYFVSVLKLLLKSTKPKWYINVCIAVSLSRFVMIHFGSYSITLEYNVFMVCPREPL